MRCHYLSDLHLENQDFPWGLPSGEVLIVAGDTCHARPLDPERRDRCSVEQRDRVMRFVDCALSRFKHVLMIAGNHEHYDGVFEDTADMLGRYLPGVRVLDNSGVTINGVRFLGTTLWSNFDGGSLASMDAVRRRMGEYFFVKTRLGRPDDRDRLARFRPDDAAAAFEVAWRWLRAELAAAGAAKVVVVTHHAPSLAGLNLRYSGNGLDGAYASDLDREIAAFQNVPFWVHGHTHIARKYAIGATQVVTNCRGFDSNDASARSFSPARFFEVA